MSLVHPSRSGRLALPAAALPAAREVALVGGMFLLYRAGRSLVADHTAAAVANAGAVHHAERVLGLPSEAALQSLVPDWLLHAANYYYVGVHFPLMVSFLLWGWLRRPRAEYEWARNLLLGLTGAGLVVHIVFPLAPPRMFPGWGFVDTMAVLGPDAYAGASGTAVNQLAAMPSLHIGWALLIAYVVARTGPRPLAALAALHAAVTVLVVVVTANHYWLDGVVAAALLTAVVLALPGPPPARTREVTPAAGRPAPRPALRVR